MAAEYDVWIRGATLFDGSGAPPRVADVALRGDRIARVSGREDAQGGLADAHAPVAIDARGGALAPRFIDVHTHDDIAQVVRPEMDFKILGGVTTVVVGNCGFGAAPYPMATYMARTFHPGAKLPEWSGYSGYLAQLEREPASTNAAVLVGHGTLRSSVMRNENRAPTASELDAMQAIVREGRDAGAVGFSSGLVYEPGKFATTDELVALAGIMSGSGALYATHMRNEGAQLVESVREAIEIGRRAGVPVQISHHKASGADAWGLVHESLRLIERAQADGLDVHADQYPYTAGSTTLLAIVQNGHFEKVPSALGSIAPEDVVIASAPKRRDWEGRSIAQLAQELELPAHEAAQRALELSPGITAVMHTMNENDVRTVMRHPSTMIGSDGIPSLPGKPHPRLWGTFARVLGRYARELGLFPLEQAVHRMTGMAARKFGLRDRGVIRDGAFADLVLFDAARVIDVGTYEDPNHPPAGIAHVFVNGTRVGRDGAHTGARPGRPLRRASVGA